MRTIKGSNGDIFIKTFSPYSVVMEDGRTRVWLNAEDKAKLTNELVFFTKWWNKPYQEKQN